MESIKHPLIRWYHFIPALAITVLTCLCIPFDKSIILGKDAFFDSDIQKKKIVFFGLLAALGLPFALTIVFMIKAGENANEYPMVAFAISSFLLTISPFLLKFGNKSDYSEEF